MTGQAEPTASGEPKTPANARSGHHTSRTLSPVAERFVRAVLDDPECGYLHVPRFRPALLAWGAAEARVVVLEEYIARLTPEQAAASDRGRRSLTELLRQWQATAARRRKELLLTERPIITGGTP